MIIVKLKIRIMLTFVARYLSNLEKSLTSSVAMTTTIKDITLILLKQVRKHYLFLTFISIFFILITVAMIFKYLSMRIHVMDYGLEHQVLHNTANWRIFDSSYEVGNYLGDHFSPIILLFAPLYALLPIGITPIILQNLCFVIGLAGIYKLALKLISPRAIGIATACVFLALIFNPATSMLIFHYHPIVFSFPFIIWGYYYLFHTQKTWLAVILLLIAMTGKEDVGLTIATIFGFRFLERKDWRMLLLSFVCLLYTFVVVKFAIPYFRMGVVQDSASKYTYLLNGTIEERFKKIFLVREKYNYLAKMFIPLLFLPLLRGWRFLIVIPALAINLMSNPESHNMYSMEFHYDVVTSALLFCLMVEGLKNALVIWHKRIAPALYFDIFLRSATPFFLLLILIVNLTSIIGPNNRLINELSYQTFHINIAQYRELRYLQSKLPINSTIMFDNVSGGYFAKFPNSRCTPGFCGESKGVTIEEIDYIFYWKEALNTHEKDYRQFLEKNKNQLELFLETKYYVIYRKMGIDKT